MKGSLAGRVVAVTGGASGIGAATAQALAKAGAAVAILDKDGAAAKALAEAVCKDGAAAGFELDVTDAGRVADVLTDAQAALGPLYGLVNNAGIAERRRFLELSVEEWRAVLEVNLTGAFLCAQAAARSMIDHGQGGVIVNVASVAGLTGVRNRTAYGAAKHGVVGLTKVMALDLAQHGIRVNAVAPGAVETPLTAPLLSDEKARERVVAAYPLGRWGQPNEVADLIVFLASPGAAFITGAAIPIDGGLLAGAAS